MSNHSTTSLRQRICCWPKFFAISLILSISGLAQPAFAFDNLLEKSNLISQELQDPPALEKVCSVTAFSEAANGHALYLFDIPGITPLFDFADGSPGSLAFYNDGTAHFTGRVENKANPSLKWDIDFWFSGQMDWQAWSALGRNWKNEGQGGGNAYENWDYYTFDPGKTSSLTGAGGLVGSSLIITHMPADYNYGYQVGDYANCKNGSLGSAAWFFINGTVQGNTIVNGHGDINLNHACGIVEIVCPLDAYATGSHAVWLNNIMAGLGPNWVNVPFQGLQLARLDDGKAHISGKIQSQSDPAKVLFLDFWFSDQADWTTWSGLGRSWKGSAANVGLNYLNWDFYTFDPSRTSTITSCSPATLNTYLVATHMPASYLYGLQIGQGANDKNAAYGASTWFFLNGTFMGNSVVNKQGDINIVTECDFNEIICVDTPPVIACPADVTIDCTESTEPEFTGFATSDKPNSLCPGPVIISYSDADAVIDGCTTTIVRTWNVIDQFNNEDSCTQTITIIDDTAPVLNMPAITSVDLSCGALNLNDIIAFANGQQVPGFLQAARQLFMQNGLVPTGTTDDCNDSDWDEVDISVVISEDCPLLATLTCTFVAVDVCGNTSAPVSTSINFVDNVAPVITCPADITVDCDSDTSPAVTGFATAIDNCSQDVIITYVDLAPTGICPSAFIRVWSATDACGYIATCEQLITVVEEVQPDCAAAPSNLDAEIAGPNSVLVTWDPVQGSIGCRIFARIAGMSGSITVATVTGPEPSEYLAISNQLQNGRVIEWRVICACSMNPLIVTPYSAWDTFTFVTPSNSNVTTSGTTTETNASVRIGSVYPNPTLDRSFLSTTMKEGDLIFVRDISGAKIASHKVQAESNVFEIDLTTLARGVYFVEHVDELGMPQVYKIVKN